MSDFDKNDFIDENFDDEVDQDTVYINRGFPGGLNQAAAEYVDHWHPAATHAERRRMSSKIVRYVWSTGEPVERAYIKLFG